MKIGKIVTLGLAGFAGYTAYQLYRDRHVIKDELAEADTIAQAIAKDLDNITKNLNIIKAQAPKLEEISQDLGYKARVFNHESQTRLAQIKERLESYQNPDK